MFTGMPAKGEYPLDVHTSVWAMTKKIVPGRLVDPYKFIFLFGDKQLGFFRALALKQQKEDSRQEGNLCSHGP